MKINIKYVFICKIVGNCKKYGILEEVQEKKKILNNNIKYNTFLLLNNKIKIKYFLFLTLSVIVNKIWNMVKGLFTDIFLDVVSEIVYS